MICLDNMNLSLFQQNYGWRSNLVLSWRKSSWAFQKKALLRFLKEKVGDNTVFKGLDAFFRRKESARASAKGADSSRWYHPEKETYLLFFLEQYAFDQTCTEI